MTQFLLIVEDISKYSKSEINEGKTPSDVYTICSCIRNVFCLSYSIRKQNIFFIYIIKNNLMIKFEGITLKYLGPDERSQSLLLNKALNRLDEKIIIENNNNWLQSTPGIFIKKLTSDQNVMNFFNSLNNEMIIFFNGENLVLDNIGTIPDKLYAKLENCLLIFTLNIFEAENINFLRNLTNYKNILSYKLPNIKSVQDKILYINFQIDRFKKKNKVTP
ncbi:MAG: hypothetical protein P8Y23_07135 [Candidatus Lokiarchaeota archaeon]